MKTLILLILCIIGVSISGTSYSQSSESGKIIGHINDTIKLKDNHFSQDTINYTGIKSVNSYQNTVSKTISSGIEISGSYYFSDFPGVRSYGVSLAFYPHQNSFLNRKNYGYSEYSPLLHTYNEKQMDSRYSDTFLYYAPGISVFSKNRKVSLELFHTLNSQIIVNGRQQTMPYKVNFRF